MITRGEMRGVMALAAILVAVAMGVAFGGRCEGPENESAADGVVAVSEPSVIAEPEDTVAGRKDIPRSKCGEKARKMKTKAAPTPPRESPLECPVPEGHAR